MSEIDTVVTNADEISEEGTVYQLNEDEYNSLIAGLNRYKQLYEDTAKQLEDEKKNVVDLLGRIEALEDHIRILEMSN